MRNDFRILRRKQLNRYLESFRAAGKVPPPQKGWIRAIREALGVSSGELGRRLGTSRQLALQQERAEAEDRITLKSLRALANALDCDLVYALVPRAESLEALSEARTNAQAKKNVLRVEHSMALEDQAAEGLDQAIATEARRLAKKRSER